MKRIILVLALINSVLNIYAQNKFKFGTCPEELLRQTTYEKIEKSQIGRITLKKP